MTALLFYCQHSLGLGHLARSLRLAAGLANAFEVTLLNGGQFPRGTVVPPGVEVVNLPPLGHDAAYRLVSHNPSLSVAAACEKRRRLVLDAFARVRPEVLVVEMYPFGRKKFEFELVPLLEAAHARTDRPAIVCSLRDLLVSGRRDQAAYDERASTRANRWFDAIAVHADPSFVRLEESFAPATPLRVPVHYTGFVAPAAGPGGTRERLARVLVSSGGGMVGEPLVRAAVAAAPQVWADTGLHTTVIGGPFLPEPVWRWLAAQAAGSPHLRAVRQVADLRAEIQQSCVSVSQAGYNTVMDLLRARVPAVLVPFGDDGEDEQRRRAERLDRLGVARLLPNPELDGSRLASEITLAARRQPTQVTLDLEGAAHTAAWVQSLLGVRRGAGVPA